MKGGGIVCGMIEANWGNEFSGRAGADTKKNRAGGFRSRTGNFGFDRTARKIESRNFSTLDYIYRRHSARTRRIKSATNRHGAAVGYFSSRLAY